MKRHVDTVGSSALYTAQHERLLARDTLHQYSQCFARPSQQQQQQRQRRQRH